MANIKSVEIDGYNLDVDLDNFDDVRFFEMTEQLDEHPKLFIDVLKLGIGDAAYNKFAKHFTKKDGHLKMSTVTTAVNKILDITDPKEEASGQSGNSTQTN